MELSGLCAVADNVGGVVTCEPAREFFGGTYILGYQSGQIKERVGVDTCFGADGLHFCLELSDLGHHAVLPIGHAVTGHNAHVKAETAVLGGDVVGGAAADRAAMQGRIGRIKRRIDIARRFGRIFCVHLIGPVD